jgi:uncharacterized membrane protein YtjA (UPF0391 family)
MLSRWVLFVVIAPVTALFGLEGFARGEAGPAQVYFLIFMVVTAFLLAIRYLGRDDVWLANPARILAGIWGPLDRDRGF